MKKRYIIPSMSTCEVRLEGIVAASLQIRNDKEVDTSNGEQLSNKFKSPWDASNWSE
jgi:hypothetical protein